MTSGVEWHVRVCLCVAFLLLLMMLMLLMTQMLTWPDSTADETAIIQEIKVVQESLSAATFLAVMSGRNLETQDLTHVSGPCCVYVEASGPSGECGLGLGGLWTPRLPGYKAYVLNIWPEEDHPGQGARSVGILCHMNFTNVKTSECGHSSMCVMCGFLFAVISVATRV